MNPTTLLLAVPYSIWGTSRLWSRHLLAHRRTKRSAAAQTAQYLRTELPLSSVKRKE